MLQCVSNSGVSLKEAETRTTKLISRDIRDTKAVNVHWSMNSGIKLRDKTMRQQPMKLVSRILNIEKQFLRLLLLSQTYQK